MPATAAVISPGRRGVLADLVASTVVVDAVMVAAAAGLVGALAQVSFHLPGTPVPITGQTFGVLLAGAALGWRRGSLAMALYVLAGVVGLPWFAGGAAGIVGASFGYLLSYPLAGALVGALASRGGDRSPARTVATMLAGTAVVYAVGVTWLALWMHLSPAAALGEGMVPFLPGDALKLALAAAVLPGTWRLVGRHARS